MNFLDLIKIEFMKVRRSKIIPLIFIAPLLVVISGVASLSNYFTPEYTNAWPAMFIQSALWIERTDGDRRYRRTLSDYCYRQREC